jgi:hypothetical protein
MKLTKNNYFTPKNNYLSSHKIKDYLLSPQYFKAKHIDHTIVEDATDAMHVGSMVELLLENNAMPKLTKKYNIVSRRSKDSEDKRIQVTESMFAEAMEMHLALRTTKAFAELKKFKKQVILQSGNLCGMIDYLKINEDETAVIVDLKTARTVDEHKYWYLCEDFGYFIQAACYTKLVKECYPDIKSVKFYHLSVEKDPKNIHRVRLFEFPEWKIKETEAYINVLVDEITNRTNWEPDIISFETAVLLNNPKNKRMEEEMASLGDLIL